MKALVLFLCTSLLAAAQTVDVEPPLEMSVAMEAQVSLARGLGYLVETQEPAGDWSGHPGITAACVAALVGVEQERTTPAIERGLAFLRRQVRPDGTLGIRAGEVDVYATSISLIAFVLADRPEDQPLITRLAKALQEHQLPKGMSYASGGFRYHTDQYPDLSNTHWALEALYLVNSRDPQAAPPERLWHTARNLILACQLPERAGKDAGGFTYYPLAAAETPRHQEQLAEARVWGSLTYGGLKSLIYTGMQDDAEQVRAARQWLLSHYTVEHNPGLAKGGLYYHLYMLVTAHALLGDKQLTMPDGQERNWRQDAVTQLLSAQRSAGHWRNENALWMENDPNLCTAYALLALEIILSE